MLHVEQEGLNPLISSRSERIVCTAKDLYLLHCVRPLCKIAVDLLLSPFPLSNQPIMPLPPGISVLARVTSRTIGMLRSSVLFQACLIS
jgi:hypothetical protein